MEMIPFSDYQRAASYLRPLLPLPSYPLAIVLGSGLGELGDKLTGPVAIPYAAIPGFAQSGAPGHRGVLLAGELAGRGVLCMQGRLHRYEGHGFAQVTFPVRVLRLLGVETLLVTNAAGGINAGYAVGDVMVIADHINLMGGNPLAGLHEPAFGERFFDMGAAYAPVLRKLAHACAARLGMSLREGVYVAVTGPSYETPAEIRAFRALGADAVGMSTVPEVICARHCGMDILGLSLITNMAAGVTDAVLSGEEVIAIGRAKAREMESLVTEIVKEI
ncbi:MAG: purine-nucleoside phosphorylase [Oscillospiraceae bacterium]|jgi:purine-nucleoside phosphorylase|nr:purine-nucleoside phosphorylase [Oscillospiraceae bacterium]